MSPGRLGRILGHANHGYEISSRHAAKEEEFDPDELRSSMSFTSFEKQIKDVDSIIAAKSQKSDDSNLRLVKFKELLKTEGSYVYCLAYYVKNNLSDLKVNKICSQKKIEVWIELIKNIIVNANISAQDIEQ